MSLGRIPWYEALRWARTYEFDEDDTEAFIELIERLDLAELRLMHPKTKEAPNGTKGASPS